MSGLSGSSGLGGGSGLSRGLGLWSGGSGFSAGEAQPRIAITIAAPDEDAEVGTIIGTPYVANGTAAGPITISADPDNKFDMDGGDLVTDAALDYETATSHSVTLTDGVLEKTFLIPVGNILEITLGDLTLSSSTFLLGTPSSGTINGATPGSTITGGSLPSGFTIDGPNRTWAWDGTGSVSTGDLTLTEAHADGVNSPKANVIGYEITDEVVPVYRVILVAGQSNGKGSGVAIGSTADVANVEQWIADTGNGAYQTISSDITPFIHPGGNTSYGPMNSFVAEYASTLQPGQKLLIVPACVASTGLIGSRWAVGGDLYLNAIAEANAAIAEAETTYPGQVVFEGIVWCQGETDAALAATKADYKAAFNATLAGFRAGITGASDSWCMIGAMPPPVIFNVSWTGQAINLAHIECALEGVNVYYVPGRQGETQGDNLHYTQAGYEHMGQDMAALLATSAGPAMVSQAAFYPTTGRKFSHTLAVASPYTTTSGGKFATIELGGADAAEFEIERAYLSAPATNVWAATVIADRLRYVGDATNSNTGTTYNITLTARDGKGNLGTPQACTVTVSAVGAVDPVAALFQNGEYGHVFDPSDLSTLKQNVAGSTAVTADGDVVGWMQSKHPNAAVFAALADNTTRPLYKVDGDAQSFIRSDGSNDILVSNVAGFNAALKWTMVVGIKGTWVSSKYLFGEYSNASAVPFLDMLWSSASSQAMIFNMRNDSSAISAGPTQTGVLDGSTKQVITTVLQGVKTTGTQRIAKIRLATGRGSGGDGTGYTTANNSLAGPVTAHRSSLFGRYPSTGASSWIGIDLYRKVSVAKELEDYEIANTEDWVNAGTRTSALP